MQPIVYVVDDDLAVREALSSLIRSVGLQVQTFASAQAFLDFDRPDAPACLVLDVRMPGLNGLELQRELARGERLLPVVFITGHGDIPMTVRAMKAGAVDFLPKPFREQDLLDAIARSLAIDGAARRQRTELAEIQARYDTLTTREREVLARVVRGLRNKQTAAELGISEVTVKVHRHNIMDKMGARSLPALTGMVDRLPPAEGGRQP
ncbi:MAG: response regulator transcription factor [Burkholderiaceae bacterium]|nr:response regulator transcription factor [Burkholderiaceae bacterium]